MSMKKPWKGPLCLSNDQRKSADLVVLAIAKQTLEDIHNGKDVVITSNTVWMSVYDSLGLSVCVHDCDFHRSYKIGREFFTPLPERHFDTRGTHILVSDFYGCSITLHNATFGDQNEKQFILNLTQHPATSEQVAEGVVDPLPEARIALSKLLNFDGAPSTAEMVERARKIVNIAVKHHALMGIGAVMIGGAPFFGAILERELKAVFPVLYSFSRRESVEKIIDGQVTKTSVFKHVCFVEP